MTYKKIFYLFMLISNSIFFYGMDSDINAVKQFQKKQNFEEESNLPCFLRPEAQQIYIGGICCVSGCIMNCMQMAQPNNDRSDDLYILGFAVTGLVLIQNGTEKFFERYNCIKKKELTKKIE